MANPVLSRVITCGDRDCIGNRIVCGKQYDLEWLRPNLAGNGGFELGDSGWNIQPQTSSVQVDSTPGWPRTGISALLIQQAPGCTWTVSTSVAALEHNRINPGRAYILRLWHRAWPGAESKFWMGIWWYDSALQYISATQQLITAGAAAYEEEEFTATAPATARYAAVYLSWHPDGTGSLVDDIEFFPSLDQREQVANPGVPIVWVTDEPTFQYLEAGSKETLTFDRAPSSGYIPAQDDPVTRMEMRSGEVVEWRNRTVKLSHSIPFSRLRIGYVHQCRRFHRKVRGKSFTWTDHWGTSRTVRWPGDFSGREHSYSLLGDATLALVEDDPEWL